jgi:hypothetical protein
MTPHQAQQLLGGYATGTLTEQERKILFQAALSDQELFDALADEEALRELLADPAARRRLAAVLAAPPPEPVRETPGWIAWLWRPMPIAAFAAFAVAVVGISVLLQKQNQEFDTVAQVRRFGAPRIEAPAPAAESRPMPDSGPRIERPTERETSPRANRASAPAGRDRAQAASAASEPAAPPPPAPARADLPAAVPPPASDATPLAASNEVRLADAGRDEVKPELAKSAEAKKETLADVAGVGRVGAAASGPPFRYWIERRQADGAWVEYGAELASTDTVRLRVVPNQPGALVLSGATPQALRVKAGGTYYLPLPAPAGAGERTLLLSLNRDIPEGTALGEAGPSESSRLARFRQSVPAGGAGRRQEKASDAARAPKTGEESHVPSAAPIHQVRIQLRYR